MSDWEGWHDKPPEEKDEVEENRSASVFTVVIFTVWFILVLTAAILREYYR